MSQPTLVPVRGFLSASWGLAVPFSIFCVSLPCDELQDHFFPHVPLSSFRVFFFLPAGYGRVEALVRVLTSAQEGLSIAIPDFFSSFYFPSGMGGWLGPLRKRFYCSWGFFSPPRLLPYSAVDRRRRSSRHPPLIAPLSKPALLVRFTHVTFLCSPLL